MDAKLPENAAEALVAAGSVFSQVVQANSSGSGSTFTRRRRAGNKHLRDAQGLNTNNLNFFCKLAGLEYLKSHFLRLLHQQGFFFHFSPFVRLTNTSNIFSYRL